MRVHFKLFPDHLIHIGQERFIRRIVWRNCFVPLGLAMVLQEDHPCAEICAKERVFIRLCLHCGHCSSTDSRHIVYGKSTLLTRATRS